MAELYGKGQAEFPRYDFLTGSRGVGRLVRGGGIVIVEGIHALNPLVKLSADRQCLSIFINTASGFYDGDTTVLSPRDVRFVRRLIRDYKFRGSSAENTFKLWQGVILTEGEYIMPYAETADFILDTTFACEPFIFAAEAINLLQETLNGIYGVPSQSVIKSLELFGNPINEKSVPPDSILREFIGGSELFEKYF